MLFFRREMQQKTDRPVIPPHPNTNMCTTQKDRKQRKPLLAVFLWSKCGDSNSVPLGPKRIYDGNFR